MKGKSLVFKQVTVVELTHAIAGPTAGQVFSDLSATVIKIKK